MALKAICQMIFLYQTISKGDRRGSNPRQPAPQAGALPTELRPPVLIRDSSTSLGMTSISEVIIAN